MTSGERIEAAERMRGPFDVCECMGHTYINGTLLGMQVCARDETGLRKGNGGALMEAYIYRMPDGTLRLQCGSCGALLPQLRILAGQRNGPFIPSRCPECGSTIMGVQGTEDWSAEDGD